MLWIYKHEYDNYGDNIEEGSIEILGVYRRRDEAERFFKKIIQRRRTLSLGCESNIGPNAVIFDDDYDTSCVELLLVDECPY